MPSDCRSSSSQRITGIFGTHSIGVAVRLSIQYHRRRRQSSLHHWHGIDRQSTTPCGAAFSQKCSPSPSHKGCDRRHGPDQREEVPRKRQPARPTGCPWYPSHTICRRHSVRASSSQASPAIPPTPWRSCTCE